MFLASKLRLSLMVLVFSYFIFTAFLTFNKLGYLTAIYTLVIGVIFSLWIIGFNLFNTYKEAVLAFGVITFISVSISNVDNKSQQYREAINQISRNSHNFNIKDLPKVIFDCDVQKKKNKLNLVFEAMKALYYNTFMSGVDMILNLSPPVSNDICLASIKELLNSSPEIKQTMSKEVIALIYKK